MNWTDVFSYADGILYWRCRPREHFRTERGWRVFLSQRSGRIAGNNDGHGYIQVRMCKKLLQTHNIVWEMHNGTIPDGMLVDHANGIRTDNRIENLQLATRAENNRNSLLPIDNASGYKGVSLDKKSGRWKAQITVDYRNVFLGRFDSKISAALAYDNAAIELHGSFAKTNSMLGLL